MTVQTVVVFLFMRSPYAVATGIETRTERAAIVPRLLLLGGGGLSVGGRLRARGLRVGHVRLGVGGIGRAADCAADHCPGERRWSGLPARRDCRAEYCTGYSTDRGIRSGRRPG